MDHEYSSYQMKNLTGTCLNQASYSRYKGDIEAISFKAGSLTGIMFDIRFKSFEQHLEALPYMSKFLSVPK